jgi:hypothetical protein
MITNAFCCGSDPTGTSNESLLCDEMVNGQNAGIDTFTILKSATSTLHLSFGETKIGNNRTRQLLI